MKKYWFYGLLPKENIQETDLTNEQIQIIKEQKELLSKDNLYQRWIGYDLKDSWNFMRHGFEVINIKESKGNLARMKLKNVLLVKYNNEKKIS